MDSFFEKFSAERANWMKKRRFEKLILPLGGALVGLVNGLLGAGGGMIAVPMLKKSGMAQKQAHAASVLIIFFLSLFSAAVYLYEGRITLSAALPYLPGGVVGAVIGAVGLKKIPDRLLRKIFGGFMIYTGVRLWLR